MEPRTKIVFQDERCRSRSVVESVLLLSEQLQERRVHDRVEVGVYQGDTWHRSREDRETHVTLRFANGGTHVTTKHISRQQYKVMKAAYLERVTRYINDHTEQIMATGELAAAVGW